MDDLAAVSALDPSFVLLRLEAARGSLARMLLLVRIGLAGALVVVSRPGGRAGGSWWALAVFSAYLAWTMATGLNRSRLLELVGAKPRLLWIEQGMCVGMVILGGGGRVIILYICALPVIFATVFVGPRAGLALAIADALAVSAALGGSSLTGTSLGTEPVHGTEWPPALIGLFIAVGLFAYVRRLFAELERTGNAYRARAEELAHAVAGNSRLAARTAALSEIVGLLEGVIPDLRRRLERLGQRRRFDSVWQSECQQLTRLADHAEASLAELSSHAPAPTLDDSVATIVQTAVSRVLALGATPVAVTIHDCDVRLSGDARGQALARFVEEGLWNAHKHGRPPISLKAGSSNGQVTVAIADHGSGFRAQPGPDRFGLRSLRRDAELLKGELRVSAEPDQPFTVSLTFNAPAKDR